MRRPSSTLLLCAAGIGLSLLSSTSAAAQEETAPVMPPPVESGVHHAFVKPGETYTMIFGQGRLPQLTVTILELLDDHWARAWDRDHEVWINLDSAVLMFLPEPDEEAPAGQGEGDGTGGGRRRRGGEPQGRS